MQNFGSSNTLAGMLHNAGFYLPCRFDMLKNTCDISNYNYSILTCHVILRRQRSEQLYRELKFKGEKRIKAGLTEFYKATRSVVSNRTNRTNLPYILK